MKHATIVRAAVAVTLAAALALAAPCAAHATIVNTGECAACGAWSQGWSWTSGIWERLAAWLLGFGAAPPRLVQKDAAAGNDGTAATAGSSTTGSSGGTVSGDAGVGMNPDGNS